MQYNILLLALAMLFHGVMYACHCSEVARLDLMHEIYCSILEQQAQFSRIAHRVYDPYSEKERIDLCLNNERWAENRGLLLSIVNRMLPDALRLNNVCASELNIARRCARQQLEKSLQKYHECVQTYQKKGVLISEYDRIRNSAIRVCGYYTVVSAIDPEYQLLMSPKFDHVALYPLRCYVVARIVDSNFLFLSCQPEQPNLWDVPRGIRLYRSLICSEEIDAESQQ